MMYDDKVSMYFLLSDCVTVDSVTVDEGVTIPSPHPGADCSFPFTFDNVTYTGCVSLYGDPPVCPTANITDWLDQGKWGFCSTSCITEGKGLFNRFYLTSSLQPAELLY